MECEYERRKKCDSLYIERYNKLLKENEELKKCNKELEEGFKASIEELTDYANRIDKAINEMENYIRLCAEPDLNYLIDILKGEDNETN